METKSERNDSDESSVFDGLITPMPVLESNSISLPSKYGWLYKKTTSLIPRWIRRYFILEKRELRYYYTESKAKFGGVINFDIVTVEIQVKHNVFKLIALGANRAFRLRCESEQEALDWVYAISMHINSSNGRKAVFSISGKNKFWKFNRLSENEFKAMACTGDLLLFRGKDIVSTLQRFVTKSEYDHVAFILKYASGRLALFEATGADGVSIVFWDDFKFYQWENLYSRLIYRKLDFERTELILKELEGFIHSVYGKKYRISASKLMSNKHDKDPVNKRGYFCSELVAAALKALKLLPDDPPASRYWPGDFSDSKPLNLSSGATLHPGVLLDFDLK